MVKEIFLVSCDNLVLSQSCGSAWHCEDLWLGLKRNPARKLSLSSLELLRASGTRTGLWPDFSTAAPGLKSSGVRGKRIFMHLDLELSI